jgi:DNA-binding MarR family transcriptional regulator
MFNRVEISMNGKQNQYQETIVKILKVREHLYANIAGLLKPYGLTEPQFNVLRILRGAGAEGLPCLEVGRRLITRVPDVTRLLDRLEEAGLVSRQRSEEDRRVVKAMIAKPGLRLLSKLDKPLAEMQKVLMAELTRKEMSTLVKTLDKLID